MAGEALLPVSAGYGVVLGLVAFERLLLSSTTSFKAENYVFHNYSIGFFFSALMIGISWIQNRYTKYKTSSIEEFTSASKSVPAGLIASGIVVSTTILLKRGATAIISDKLHV
jgi:hypothetical protein